MLRHNLLNNIVLLSFIQYYNSDYMKDMNKLLSIFNEKESEHNWEKFNNSLKQFKEITVQIVNSPDYNDILKSFSGAILNSVCHIF